VNEKVCVHFSLPLSATRRVKYRNLLAQPYRASLRDLPGHVRYP
jgi:hypothetical protein